LTLWPNGVSRPLSSNLNFDAGQTIANQAVVQVDKDGKISVFNNTGSAHFIVDVVGYHKKDKDIINNTWTSSYLSSFVNPAKKMEYDLQISAPSTVPSGMLYADIGTNSLVTPGFDRHLIEPNIAVPLGTTQPWIEFSCMTNQECRALAPGATVSNQVVHVPYNLNKNNPTYRFTQEITIDKAGYPGIWETVSVKAPDNVVTPLAAAYLGPKGSTLNGKPIGFDGLSVQGGLNGTSCSNPTEASLFVSNIAIDGKLVSGNSGLPTTYPADTPGCPGFGKTVYTATGVDNTVGISQTFDRQVARRDTKPPIIGSITVIGNKLSVNATDSGVDSQVIGMWAQVDNFTAYPDGGYKPWYSNNVTQTYDLGLVGAPGQHTLTVRATDNSGNVTEKVQTITIQ
jgi:hypothetical protein